MRSKKNYSRKRKSVKKNKNSFKRKSFKKKSFKKKLLKGGVQKRRNLTEQEETDLTEPDEPLTIDSTRRGSAPASALEDPTDASEVRRVQLNLSSPVPAPASASASAPALPEPPGPLSPGDISPDEYHLYLAKMRQFKNPKTLKVETYITLNEKQINDEDYDKFLKEFPEERNNYRVENNNDDMYKVTPTLFSVGERIVPWKTKRS